MCDDHDLNSSSLGPEHRALGDNAPPRETRGFGQSTSPIRGLPLASCQVLELYTKSHCNNGANISSHLLTVFRAFARDLWALDIQDTLCWEDFAMKSRSACFVLGCEGLYPFPVSLKQPRVCFRERCLEQVSQENSPACWGL